jgi:hypothetical protein
MRISDILVNERIEGKRREYVRGWMCAVMRRVKKSRREEGRDS